MKLKLKPGGDEMRWTSRPQAAVGHYTTEYSVLIVSMPYRRMAK